jgi:hypothetical protein
MTRALSGAAPPRLSSSLHEANNDTGRVAFCGPIVVSAITGYSVSKIEAEVHAFRNVTPGRSRAVKGTYPEEVAAALAHFGYSMQLSRCATPTPTAPGSSCATGPTAPSASWRSTR